MKNSRKIFFAIRNGQKLGSDWNIQSRMRHDYESFRTGGLGGFGVGSVVESWHHSRRRSSCGLSSSCCGHLFISAPRNLLIRPQGLKGLSGYGSEETLLKVSFWVGLCCIVIKASEVLQSSPVAQLVLVLVKKTAIWSVCKWEAVIKTDCRVFQVGLVHVQMNI